MIRPKLVVDASVAVKWIAPEEASIEAQQLREGFALLAPELIYAECANIIWKKVRKGNIPESGAVRAAEILASVEVETFSLGPLSPTAVELSVRLNHPAYDCFYLALAVNEDCRMVTADERLLRVIKQSAYRDLIPYCVLLSDFAL